ncbi:MAG: 50S ribosomal protein L9 [Candidatus Omnitrophota bacterium]|nr:50S ribosomal protein L9 [Candidatus Omnitrophota bacterium]
MKVIILKDTDKLGEMGDELQVKDGYARNYLIPNGLAIESTKGALRILEEKKREKAKREKKMKEACEKLAEKIAASSCTITMEAGEEDKLFGTVTSEKIANCLSEEGIEVDKKKIVLEEPIKTLGVYNIEIDLHPEVKAQARIWVVKK